MAFIHLPLIFIESSFSYITNKICDSNDLRYTLCYVAVLYYYICKKQVEGYRVRNMKQLMISDKVQKEMLTDLMIMKGTNGLIGGYCEDEFPVCSMI